MAKTTFETSIEYLAKRTFPDYHLIQLGNQIEASLPSNATRAANTERRAKFKEWMDRHSAMPTAELQALVAAERNREALQLRNLEARHEAGLFFNQSNATANFDDWSKMYHWTIDEGIALSLGKCPSKVNIDAISPFSKTHSSGKPNTEWPASPFAVEYVKRHEFARRAMAWKKLFDPCLPGLFLSWAKGLDLDVPAELVSCVVSRSGATVDWEARYKATVSRLEKNELELAKKDAELVAKDELAKALRSAIDEVGSAGIAAAKQRNTLQADTLRLSAECDSLRAEVARLSSQADEVENEDPGDRPAELDFANVAYRAVRNGYEDRTNATFRNRVLAWLRANAQELGDEAHQRIAAVANPDKKTGRKSKGK